MKSLGSGEYGRKAELKKLTEEEGDLRSISRVEEHMTVTVLSTDRILTPHVT
jgi:hypothetical protein